MKISKIRIKNFRCYKEEIEICAKDMNTILGKNDAGKSSILEALDIFFNEGKGCVAIGFNDLNNEAFRAGEETIEITISFKDFDDSITLETIPTSISGEYLTNKDGELEIKKVYQGKTMKPVTHIIASHPSNDDALKKLLTTKIKDLQQYVKDKGITVVGKASVSCELRKAIRDHYGSGLQLETQEIIVEGVKEVGEGAKEIWEKIAVKLPTFILFQSDRSNTDQDSEIQDPMSIALDTILKDPEILQRLEEVFEKVKEKTGAVAAGTLLQLHKINPTLASQLDVKPPEKLAWAKAFPKTEIESDTIPLNKRGSGVKRMILLSFFLNEVERRKTEEGLKNIIYAFEEPETSQHPDHQEKLIQAFVVLSKTAGVQILLTTHSPYVYKNLVNDVGNQLIFIGNDALGNKICLDVRSNFKSFPWSPSWGEINYFVYELPTLEFFDELYSRLEELNNTGSHVDNYINAKSGGSIVISERWHRAEADGTQKMDRGMPVIDTRTYITCLRHQIHHPTNRLNSTNYLLRIKDAIDDMIELI